MIISLIMLGLGNAHGQNNPTEYEVNKGLVVAYNLKGKKLWSFETIGRVDTTTITPQEIFVRATHYKGVHTGPNAFHFTNTYVKTRIYCLDPNTGKARWEVGKNGHKLSMPVPTGDRVIIATGKLDRESFKLYPKPEPKPALFALERTTGQVLWENTLPEFIGDDAGDGRSKITSVYLTITDQTAISITNPFVKMKINFWDVSSGKLRSSVSLSDLTQEKTDKEITELVDFKLGKDLYILLRWLSDRQLPGRGTQKTFLISLDHSSGNPLWKTQTENFPLSASLICERDIVYLFADLDGALATGLFSFDAASGNLNWRIEEKTRFGPWQIGSKEHVGVWIYSSRFLRAIDLKTGNKSLPISPVFEGSNYKILPLQSQGKHFYFLLKGEVENQIESGKTVER